jgi:plastocyanin
MNKNVKILTLGNRLLHCAVCGLAGAVLSWSHPAFGVDASINIINFAFSPNTVNVGVNDTVTWNWVGSPHTTTSDTGLWDSGVFGTGHTFSQKFTSAGSFPFHCVVHPFMTGTVVVQAPKVPPTVAFANPANGSVFAAPASFPLTVTASDTNGSVTNVQFFQGATLLGNAINSPYSVSVRNLAAGAYTFSAVATDSAGSRATNQVTVSVVEPAPIKLSSPQQLSATRFQFSYSATIGLSYIVQRSLDVTHWTALSTNIATASSVVFTDQNATGTRWFYRVDLLPNP